MTYVAVVTGASSGIGEATARRLAREADVRLVLVARRRDRLESLAGELGVPTTVVPVDLIEADAPALVAAAVEQEAGTLNLLVNNAGASWRGTFGDRGWAGVERHMRINFDAQVRLTEALLPLLRRTAAEAGRPGAGPPAATEPAKRLRGLRAPVSIVNVASTSARISRPRAGAYSASKFALAGWSDALHLEELPYGVHVGLVLPGFVATEGFPQRELVSHPIKRLIVSTPEKVAEAILDAGPGGRAERYVPRPYWIPAALRVLAPALVRRGVASGGFTPSTPATDREQAPPTQNLQ